MKNKVQEVYRVNISVQTINRHLRNNEDTKSKRIKYVERMDDMFGKVHMIFIDETNFNLYCLRSKGRSVAGKKAITKTFNGKGKQVSLILAISGIIGIVYYEIIDGSCDGQKYKVFISNLIERIKKRKENFVIIQDNFSAHKCKEVNEFMNTVDQIKFKLDYTPPWSSELNPVEFVFNNIKSEFKRLNKDSFNKITNIMRTKNVNQKNARHIYITELIEQCLKDYDVVKCSNCFSRMQSVLEKCRRNKDI